MDAAASIPNPTASESSSPEPKTRKPPKNLERLVRVWKRVYVLAKKLEPKVETARKAVVELLVAAGIQPGEVLATKNGNISLQTRTTTDWEAMVRAIVSPAFVAQLVPQFTKESAPFVRAPSSWSGEAKS